MSDMTVGAAANALNTRLAAGTAAVKQALASEQMAVAMLSQATDAQAGRQQPAGPAAQPSDSNAPRGTYLDIKV